MVSVECGPVCAELLASLGPELGWFWTQDTTPKDLLMVQVPGPFYTMIATFEDQGIFIPNHPRLFLQRLCSLDKTPVKWTPSQFCLCVRTIRSVLYVHIFQGEGLAYFVEFSKRVSKINWWLLSHPPAQYEGVEIEEEGEEIGEKNFFGESW